MSHPTWVRGLKLFITATLAMVSLVAPYVGAWIETSYAGSNEAEAKVAPYVGAWIETYDTFDEENDNKSHPTWVRGLKHHARRVY